jgi:DNA-binding MurR/RpiR family transcriptional regulator
VYRERIRNNYDRLSKSQRRIADYLMTSHREAAFMTASHMATILDVDVATITRFAQRLGYPGYPELLDEVQALVREEMSTGYHPAEGTSAEGRVFLRSLANEHENLERTINTISVESVEKALALMRKARLIYVVGQHTGSFMARNLALRLSMVGLPAIPVATDGVSTAISMRNLGPEDVMIAFGFSGYVTDVVAAQQVARRRGAPTIGIVGSEVTATARHADVVLVCAAGSPLHIPSETAVTAVIEALFAALGTERAQNFNSEVKAFSDFYQSLIEFASQPATSAEESVMKLY